MRKSSDKLTVVIITGAFTKLCIKNFGYIFVLLSISGNPFIIGLIIAGISMRNMHSQK